MSQLAVRHDLAQALPANVTVCLAVTRRLMGWSYRTAMHELSVKGGWRWMCQLCLQPVPNFRMIQNREAKLTPTTIHLISQVVVWLGHRLGVTKAEKLRVDGSVAETNIHFTCTQVQVGKPLTWPTPLVAGRSRRLKTPASLRL